MGVVAVVEAAHESLDVIVHRTTVQMEIVQSRIMYKMYDFFSSPSSPFFFFRFFLLSFFFSETYSPSI